MDQCLANPGQTGWIESPLGLIAPSFITDLLRSRCQKIAGCRRHFPPACDCWSTQRSTLLQSQNIHGAKSPEASAAAKIYEALEALEAAATRAWQGCKSLDTEDLTPLLQCDARGIQ
jgi:hypothetical protein